MVRYNLCYAQPSPQTSQHLCIISQKRQTKCTILETAFMNEQDLANKRVIVLAHILTTVPAQDLKEYLIKTGAKEVMFIGHPLYYKQGRPGSFFELIKNGKQTKRVQLNNWKINQFIRYFADIVLSLYWILTTSGRWDIIIALDNLNSLAGLLLKKLGKVEKVVYYAIDFTPQRFPNNLLNRLYHYIEKLCVSYADITWNVSPRIAEGRYKLLGMNQIRYNKQITVPIGIWLDRIKRVELENTEPHTAIYAGSLSPHQGVQLVVDAIPKIVVKIPDFKFIVVGMGEYEKKLKKQVKELDVEKYVEFLGYFEKHEDVENILSKCGLGLAMYSAELSKWSYYADPSKIKSYLACGLPVVTTNLTYIAHDIEQRRCGIVCDYNKDCLSEAIIKIALDSGIRREFRQNAINFAKDFDWGMIFSRGINALNNVSETGQHMKIKINHPNAHTTAV